MQSSGNIFGGKIVYSYGELLNRSYTASNILEQKNIFAILLVQRPQILILIAMRFCVK